MPICLGLLAPLSSGQAVPVQFAGQATVGVMQADNGFLADFLGTQPTVGDTLTFSIVFDADTVGPQQFIAPDVVRYTGGITASSFTLNGVTLQTAPGDPASVLVTTLDTPGVLGIPGFADGYSITAGGATGGQGRRWAINFFFYGALGGLPDLSAPTTLPDIADFQAVGLGYRSFRNVNGNEIFDGFGAPLDSLAAVPAPPAVWLMLTAIATAFFNGAGSKFRSFRSTSR
ncbi:MAG: hypothetical protein IT486_02320 [Gammaproteobacteria bacterium]|nr:hypothetical protein [Gammaproteobacteria bacterium]